MKILHNENANYDISTDTTLPSFQTPYQKHKIPREDCSEPSKTVPDQVLSLREILVRHSRGISAGTSLGTPQYDGDEIEYNVLRTLSKLEQLEMAREMHKKVEEIKAKRKAEEERRQQLIREAQERKKQQQQQQQQQQA